MCEHNNAGQLMCEECQEKAKKHIRPDAYTYREKDTLVRSRMPGKYQEVGGKTDAA